MARKTKKLDLIEVCEFFDACSSGVDWLRRRRLQDPRASFSKRWSEACVARESEAAWLARAAGFACYPKDCLLPGELVPDDIDPRELQMALVRAVASHAEGDRLWMVEESLRHLVKDAVELLREHGTAP